ncbi:MAG: tetratricopeptide repeat-containing serine protease family protein [Syntrophales bacterium]|nr:tetratricopeptide repeat-containing serine protease family protein [Syntrophales bacterium]
MGFCAWEPPVPPSVVTVVGLDGQGNPGPRGLGVIIGKGERVLTSASLFAGQDAGVIKTGKGEMRLIRAVAGVDPASDLAVVQTTEKCGSPVEVAGIHRLQFKNEVRFPVPGQAGLDWSTARVSGILPLSPRLTLIKVDADNLPELAGTPLYNRQGELVAMLHAFSAGETPTGIRFFLALNQGNFPGSGDRSKSKDLRKSAAWQAFWEGVAAGQRQNWSEAQKSFAAALRLQEKFPEAYCGRGVARHHLGDYPGAVQDLEEASRRLPGYALAYLWLGKTWERLGNREGAAKAFSQAVAACPDLSEASFLLGEMAYRQEQLAKAREYLEKPQDDFPQAARRWWYLGNISRAQERFGEALADYDRAVKLEPIFPAAYLEAGKVLLVDLGRSQEAAVKLKEAVRLQPKDSAARYYLGLAHGLSWNFGAAWEQYFTLQDLNPTLAEQLATVLEQRR